MPATHREVWRRHFEEYPIGDFHTQMLLAQLIIMFYSANKDSKSPPLKLEDVAPQLVTASARLNKTKRRDKVLSTAISQIIDAANS